MRLQINILQFRFIFLGILAFFLRIERYYKSELRDIINQNCEILISKSQKISQNSEIDIYINHN